MFARPDCKICAGQGLIAVDDLNTRLCPCAYALAMVNHLGPEVAQAPNLTSSPLYVFAKTTGSPPEQDRTQENVFIRTGWLEFLPHLKFALFVKGLDFRFKIITDEKIRTVFVGNESYVARPRAEREDHETYNSLSDLVSDPHLLVLRLGFLGHKNIAASGALKEALMLREISRKPTWLIEDPENTFGPGCFSYSDEVWSYITARFKVNLDLQGSVPSVTGGGSSQIRFETVGQVMEAPAMAIEDYDSVAEQVSTKKNQTYQPPATKGYSKPSKSAWKNKSKSRMGDDF